MATRNIDLHGTKVPPSEIQRRINGLVTRRAINKQLIQLLTTYRDCATLLQAEYGASRAYPECCAQFQKDKTLAAAQLVVLRGVQESIGKEIDTLSGQLPLPEDGPNADVH